MKLWFLILLLSACCLPVAAQNAIGESRDWTSHSGSKMHGSLIGCVDGKVVLRSANGRALTVATDQFTAADVKFLKRSAFQELAAHVKQSPGKTNANWPDVLFVDPADSSATKGEKDGKWFTWTTKHWKIHTERDIPQPIIEELALIFEGTMTAIGLVSPTLVPAEKKLNIHLFASLDGLKEEVQRSGPGRDNDWNSVVCVDEMLGLRDDNGKFSLDPAAPNRFLRMELFELALREAGAGGPMPTWLYYGFSRLVSRIPQRGSAIFPAAAFAELTSDSFRKRAFETMHGLPEITSGQWFDSTPEMRKGKTEPTYRRHLRQASFVYCGYLRALNPNGAENTEKLIQAAVNHSGDGAREKLNAIALGGKEIADHIEQIGSSYTQFHSRQWQPLSAATIRRPRNWVNKTGKTLRAELRGVQGGGKVYLKASNGKGYFIPVAQLSGRDQAYALANLWKSIDYETILINVGGSSAMSKNFWPSTLSFPAGGITRARISKEESEEGKYVYKTKHFHFSLFGRLPITELQMEEIARLFEATRELLSKSPIGVQASPIDGYFRAELYDTDAAYHLAGGPKMSGGVYKRSSRTFLVPVERGMTKPADGGLNAIGDKVMEVDYRKETLVHEITHMMMHDILTRLPIFMIEGTAEYVEHMPRKQDAFHQALMMEGIREQADYYERKQGYYSRKGEDVPGPYDFEKLLTMSRRDWYEYMGDSSHRQGALYFGSFLLVSYFMEEEPERIIAMLQACRKDAPGVKVYDYEDEQYDKAVEDFKKFPGVKVDGKSYSYSSHLPHPDRPVPPQSGVYRSDTAHVKVLLNGRTAKEVAEKAYAWLWEHTIRIER